MAAKEQGQKEEGREYIVLVGDHSEVQYASGALGVQQGYEGLARVYGLNREAKEGTPPLLIGFPSSPMDLLKLTRDEARRVVDILRNRVGENFEKLRLHVLQIVDPADL
ncbi:MAG: hypothetical protein NTZ65_03330 [Candidatus Berkelbacteria bacterium]|nr:hypothetical protein [Candidatus Berkelbacteria bacterium]